MPDNDAHETSIAEAEWRVTAAECRLLLAMRNRARGEDDAVPAPIGRLIDELAQADARLRAVSGPSARGRDPREPTLDAAGSGSDEGLSLAAQGNGSFTKPLQIGGR